MSCKRPNVARSDAKAIGELNEPLRSRIYTATLDAPRRKLVLVSGYRDPGRQWDLRHERCRGRECDRGCKGYPVTAVPAIYNPKTGRWEGGSRHQHREAADMGGYDLQWLIDHRHEYGLVLTVRSENWHFEVGRTDVRSGRSNPQPTRRIIPWPGSGSTPAKPPVQEDDDMTPAQEQLLKDTLAVGHEAKNAAQRIEAVAMQNTAIEQRLIRIEASLNIADKGVEGHDGKAPLPARNNQGIARSEGMLRDILDHFGIARKS